jgi:hypothetical protein
MPKALHRRVFMFGIEQKLQVECSEQWVSDAWDRFLMLLCDIASLIRLSITIQFTGTLITPQKLA